MCSALAFRVLFSAIRNGGSRKKRLVFGRRLLIWRTIIAVMVVGALRICCALRAGMLIASVCGGSGARKVCRFRGVRGSGFVCLGVRAFACVAEESCLEL